MKIAILFQMSMLLLLRSLPVSAQTNTYPPTGAVGIGALTPVTSLDVSSMEFKEAIRSYAG